MKKNILIIAVAVAVLAVAVIAVAITNTPAPAAPDNGATTAAASNADTTSTPPTEFPMIGSGELFKIMLTCNGQKIDNVVYLHDDGVIVFNDSTSRFELISANGSVIDPDYSMIDDLDSETEAKLAKLGLKIENESLYNNGAMLCKHVRSICLSLYNSDLIYIDSDGNAFLYKDGAANVLLKGGAIAVHMYDGVRAILLEDGDPRATDNEANAYGWYRFFYEPDR